MAWSLLITVRFSEGRYHGQEVRLNRPDGWPPSPSRLFQALVAGAARGAKLLAEDELALRRLETLGAPIIAAPAARKGQSYKTFVPNNDLDKYRGDLGKIGKIRTPKTIRPYIFDAKTPLMFIWPLRSKTADENHARTICQIAKRLYQLGRGVDMAWACAELLDAGEVEIRLARHGGVVHRPSKGGTGNILLCPTKGSFKSLKKRYDLNRTRFSYLRAGRKFQQAFSQPPKARFAQIAYDTPFRHFLFEIRGVNHNESFVPWPSRKAVELVVFLRDRAAGRLKEALPGRSGEINRVLIGREATEADKSSRVRIVPLPSIGHTHADQAIRRVLVEVPPNCPLRADDMAWAFSGIEKIDTATGEILWNLVRAEERGMLDHYGVGDSEQNACHVWRSITPVALPIMPASPSDKQRRRGALGAKRSAEIGRAAFAVMQALRHTGVTVALNSLRVQREPFDHKGIRAEEFATRRFAALGLHHVEISFEQAVSGTLVIGNGRYLGLGLMAPQKDILDGVLVFAIAPETNIATNDTASLLHATRRALMALSRDDNGHVPRLFSGHEREGAPARSGGHDHVFLAADDADGDGHIDRLIVAAPWACDRTKKGRHRDRAFFDRVSRKLSYVRAGRLGVLELGPASVLVANDPLIGPTCTWESRTLYRPTRHASRGKYPNAAVVLDVIAECDRRGLPKPTVELLELNAGPKGGNLSARLLLHFAIAIEGPIMLGRDSHKGGGLFAVADDKLGNG